MQPLETAILQELDQAAPYLVAWADLRGLLAERGETASEPEIVAAIGQLVAGLYVDAWPSGHWIRSPVRWSFSITARGRTWLEPLG